MKRGLRVLPLLRWGLVVVGGLMAQLAAAQADFVEKKLSSAAFSELRKGGFVIYMRHGKTDPRQPDQLAIDFNDCSTQRLLSDEGRKMAADVGKALRAAKIPIGEVFVSPMCRTRESANLVFGKTMSYTVLDDLFSSTNQTSEQKAPIIETTRRLLVTPVSQGTNRFVLAHAPNLADVMGYFPKAEATVVVFVPHGSTFEYVGSIRPDDWTNLLQHKSRN